MVEQGREPFLLPFLCCFSHTIQSLGHSFPTLCRASVGLNDVLLGPRPFLPSLRRRSLFFVRLVHRYYGAVRLLRSVHVRIVACAFANRPRSLSGRGTPEVSRFSCMLFLSVRGFSDYAGPSDRSRLTRIRRNAFLHQEESRRPDFPFFEAQSPGPPIPLSTLRATSRDASRKTEGQDGVAFSFLVGLFHSLQQFVVTQQRGNLARSRQRSQTPRRGNRFLQCAAYLESQARSWT